MTQQTISIFTSRTLTLCHIILLAASNILVQYPFSLFGLQTTWGAFTYPAIFILTDLTVRMNSAYEARKIIFRCILPGLLISCFISSYIETGSQIGWSSLLTIHPVPLRIAVASLVAYASGQLLDILVFQRYRSNSSWWLAPVLSAIAGNLVDTLLFFFIAFYHSSNLFLSQHWPEIAFMDITFKILISLIAFIPIYGLLLNLVSVKYSKKTPAQI